MDIFLEDVPIIAAIKVPDSSIVRQAEELARSESNDVLFNHVVRCYWFGELFAQQDEKKVAFIQSTADKGEKNDEIQRIRI